MKSWLGKVARCLLPAVLIAALVLPSTPVLADDDKDKDKEPKHPITVGEEVQLDKHTKVKALKKNYDEYGNLESIDYEATISSLPAITDDGQLIDVQWYKKTGADGYTYYESGNNLFTAIVTPDGRTSIRDDNGRLFVWTPTVDAGRQFLNFGEPEILLADPINENYHQNILQWTAEFKTGLFNQNTVTVQRQLRLIEGLLIEYYIIDGDPSSDFIVRRKTQSEVGAKGSLTDAMAFDSSEPEQYLKVSNQYNGFVIFADEFKDKVYPVTIDPESTFTVASSDRYYEGQEGWWGAGDHWDACHDTASPSSSYTTSVYLKAQIRASCSEDYNVDEAWIDRTVLDFDTSALPDDITITTAILKLSVLNVYTQIHSTDIILQATAGTYLYTGWTGDYGQLHTSDITAGYWGEWTLTASGRAAINETGWTIIGVREEYHDEDDVNPGFPWQSLSKYNGITFWSYEKGTGYAPKLVVTYTLAVVPPTVDTEPAYSINDTSMTLKGYLDNDGGEACVVKFEYGTTTAYGSYSSSVSGVTSDSYFNISIYGLSRGTEYHFRAIATNTAGTSYGLDATATTLPIKPTAFTATAGDELNALAWTKGTGADKTLIRFLTTGYPTSITDGTQVYFDAGVSHNHTSLTAGTTYYYSAWSESNGQYSTDYATAYATPYYLGAPDTTTNAATSVGVSTATLNAYLDALNQIGGTVSCTLQYYYGAGSWADNETTPDVLSAPGSFGEAVGSLEADTLYHCRAKAVGTNGTGYGDDVPFTTGANYAPTMTTQAATGKGLTYATINGKVTDDGGLAVTVWFKWGLSADNLNQTTSTVSGLYTDDVFYYNLSGLDPSTQYFFQAVGENTAGIGYGTILNFTTDSPSAPTVVTNDASSVGANQATLSGTVTYDGGVECEVQFEWDTDTGAPYANSTGWQSGKVTDDTFEAVISDLTVGLEYFFRAVVRNAHSTVYGGEKTFTTVFIAPTNFVAKSVGATTISLTWTRQGDQTYICYKTTGYPVDRLDGIQVYFGDANACSHDSLSPGMTYFYRAWSWRSGDVWSGEYAQDAATTLPIKTEEEKVTPEIQPTPEEIEGVYLEPSESKLSKLPFYSTINQIADTMGMDRGMAWLLTGLAVLIIAGLVTYVTTKSVLLVIAVISVGMVVGWQLDVVPLWMFIAYSLTAIFGISKIFGFLPSGGSSG